jgi:hypothetical protein
MNKVDLDFVIQPCFRTSEKIEEQDGSELHWSSSLLLELLLVFMFIRFC